MIKTLFIYINAALLLSCKTEAVPSDVLPPEKMELVLWDLIRVEQALSIPYNTDTTVNRTLKSREAYHQVLLMHKITEADFKKSFKFYEKSPADLKPILDSLRTKSADSLLVDKKPIQ